jgi:hypothetical protein
MRGQNWLRVNESVLSPDEASKSNSLRGSPVAKIVHGQKTLSGFVVVPEPVDEEQADVAKNALTFNDN